MAFPVLAEYRYETTDPLIHLCNGPYTFRRRQLPCPVRALAIMLRHFSLSLSLSLSISLVALAWMTVLRYTCTPRKSVEHTVSELKYPPRVDRETFSNAASNCETGKLVSDELKARRQVTAAGRWQHQT